MDETLIELKNINKYFGKNHVVQNISLEIKEGEFLTLLGPSGCGKTTLLRMIGGFEFPDEGEIEFKGEDLLSIPANKRKINTVFQSYALFPHLTIRENIAFPLKLRKLPEEEVRRKVDDMLEMTKLESLKDRKPSQLSGGQQQRVAIARSLVNGPEVVLLDEPLGALDLQLRKQMQLELKQLQRKMGTTYIYVTHDQEEALTMSDRIVVLNAGKIEQLDAPKAIYEHPATAFVADFLGDSNIFDGKYENGYFETEGVKVPVLHTDKGQPAHIMVRPEFTQIYKEKVKAECIEAVVTDNIFQGQVYRINLKLSSGKRIFALSKNSSFKKDDKVYVTWEKENTCAIYG